MPEPEWRAAARDDLRSIFEYIAEDNPAAALALLEEIEAKVGRLPERPKAYRPGRVAGTREMVVRPNYLVVYAEDTGDAGDPAGPARGADMAMSCSNCGKVQPIADDGHLGSGPIVLFPAA